VHEHRFIEENRWRALRFGLDGRLIDLDRRVEEPATTAVRRLMERAAAVADRVGVTEELAHLERMLADGNCAQRQLALYRDGVDIHQIHRLMVEETMADVSPPAGGRPPAPPGAGAP
jgi:carboxylate-amine ligase